MPSRCEPQDPAYFDQIAAFLYSVEKVQPTIHIDLSGGEPLMSPRFFQVASLIRQQGLTYKTITNGLLLAERCHDLLEAPPQRLWVTFNGTGSRHDQVVGMAGGYEHLRKSVANSVPLLKQVGVHTGAVLVMNSEACAYLSKDIDEIAAQGFDEIVLQHLTFIPDSVIPHHQAIYREHFGSESGFCFGEGVRQPDINAETLFGQLTGIRRRTDLPPLAIFPPLYDRDELVDYYSEMPTFWRRRRCGRALNELWVHPDGAVSVCFTHRVGHIGQPFATILASDELRHWQQRIAQLNQPLPGCMRCPRLYMTRPVEPLA